MVVPYKLPFQLDQFYVRIVEFSDNLRRPIIVEQVELPGEIHLVQFRFGWFSGSTLVHILDCFELTLHDSIRDVPEICEPAEELRYRGWHGSLGAIRIIACHR